MKEPVKTVDEVIKAIEGSGAVQAVIAKRLGVHRHTIENYIARWASVRLAYENEDRQNCDMAETVVLNAIKAGDIDTSKWYLARRRKDRYSERQQVELVTQDDIDREIENELARLAGRRQGAVSGSAEGEEPVVVDRTSTAQ